MGYTPIFNGISDIYTFMTFMTFMTKSCPIWLTNTVNNTPVFT